MAATSPRETALQVMLQLLERGRSLDDILASEWFQGLTLEPRDLGFSRELAYGLCRWYYALAELLAARLDKPLRARDRDIEIILLIGLYQLTIMQTPAHAAVNESVELVKRRGKAWASGLVNAVLRGAVRDETDLGDANPARAYPDWMRSRIENDWGDQAPAVFGAGNARAPMTLRVDCGQIARDSVIQQLAEQDMVACAHRVSTAIVLDTPCDPARLPGFTEGLISVQDAAAQLAAELLDCEPGMRVLDACAAPGGKSAHLLQLYPAITLDALDIDADRMQRVEQNLTRIGRAARLLVGDAADPGPWFDGDTYARILVDAPCSASGVIRRHPDIKLLRRESDIMPLAERQRRILDACWRLLQPGGQMLYATCSIFSKENEAQIAAFLQSHADSREVRLNDSWGAERPHGRQIMPGEDGMDGFFYALLAKTGK